ncbi:MAG: hypothetical protein FJX77_00795 [Armatimonadetes bacterium]|nr:hypothetical protein [Armatimonadota bacterium]MBM3947409.1 hypothetical protein [SAR202 cluster bacterium]
MFTLSLLTVNLLFLIPPSTDPAVPGETPRLRGVVRQAAPARSAEEDPAIQRLEARLAQLEQQAQAIRAEIAALRREAAQRRQAPLPPLPPPKLLRHYPFRSNLQDATGLGPPLKALNGTVLADRYAFAPGNGLVLENSGISDHYTLELVFRLDKVDGWQKVVDFHGREADAGLYVYEGQLQFYGHGSGGLVSPGRDVRVTLERDRRNKRVRAALDGKVVVEFTDEEGDAVFAEGVAHFLVDDNATDGREASGGELRALRVWDGPGGAAGN